jgi:hypothetical protein
MDKWGMLPLLPSYGVIWVGAGYPPSLVNVVFVVNRGDNPLCKVYKKISGKNFGKLEIYFWVKK